MMRYFGILDGSGDVWGIRIPDLPGCFAGGASPDKAVEDAISAMQEYAALVLESGGELAPPRSLEALRRANDVEFEPSRDAFVALPLLLDRGRSRRANISLDAGLLQDIDKEAQRRGLTRSAFLASAARDKIMAET
jgi:predicted RNase H-like HicB family nuclease